MLEIFLRTLPFFGLIGLGWLAARMRFFSPAATAALTRFVFYFALSAMLFRFSANLDLGSLFDTRFALAYICGSVPIWIMGFWIARKRGLAVDESAMEAHCCMTGNTGFLGVPMLVMLLGDRAVGPVLMIMMIDMLVFSSLITLIVQAARNGGMRVRALMPVLTGIVANPMIVAMTAGLLWGQAGMPMPQPFDEFLALLGAAATPGALFAIGASLAGLALTRGSAVWIGFAKLVLHPLAIGVAALFVFQIPPAVAGVMIAAAALPVAGNVYMLAQHFGVAQQRVSAAILISTAASVVTIPLVITLIAPG